MTDRIECRKEPVSGLRPLKYYVIFIFLIPTFWGFMAGAITVGQLFVSVSLFLYAIIILTLNNYDFTLIKSYSIIFFLQIVAYTLTLAVRQTSPFHIVSFSDYFDISRPILYLVAVSFPFALRLKEKDIIWIIRLIVKVSLLVSLFDVVKQLPGGDIVMKLYTHLLPNSFNYLRLSGTFAYCYNYGFILIFDLLFILYTFKRKFLWSVFVLVLIFLTGSRSVLIATFIAVTLYFMLSDRSFLSKLLIIGSFIFLITIVYSIIVTIDIPIVQNITGNIDKLLSVADNGVSSDGSAATRTKQFDFVLRNFIKFPLLGGGPQKETSAPIEIQLGYYLSSWGVVGLLLFLSSMFLAIYYAAKNYRNRNKDIAAFSKANLIWIISAFFVGMSTPITDQIRVYQLYYLVQGLEFCAYYLSKHSNIEKSLQTKINLCIERKIFLKNG